MQHVLSKLKGAWLAIGPERKRSEKVVHEKETARNSTTSGTIVPEVWIMSGLLLSLVQQTVGVNLLQKPVEKPGTNMENE
jgi:hypothetical protein